MKWYSYCYNYQITDAEDSIIYNQMQFPLRSRDYSPTKTQRYDDGKNTERMTILGIIIQLYSIRATKLEKRGKGIWRE